MNIPLDGRLLLFVLQLLFLRWLFLLRLSNVTKRHGRRGTR
jgi:hypothetical protein